jgi:hypothetical protein
MERLIRVGGIAELLLIVYLLGMMVQSVVHDGQPASATETPLKACITINAK